MNEVTMISGDAILNFAQKDTVRLMAELNKGMEGNKTAGEISVWNGWISYAVDRDLFKKKYLGLCDAIRQEMKHADGIWKCIKLTASLGMEPPDFSVLRFEGEFQKIVGERIPEMKESEGMGSFEFSYTEQELVEVWMDRNKTLDWVYAVVQWAKRRNVLDCPGSIRCMTSIMDRMERGGGVDAVMKDVDIFTVRQITTTENP